MTDKSLFDTSILTLEMHLHTQSKTGKMEIFEKYVVPVYSSYTDWYADIAQRIQTNVHYIYENVFFVKVDLNEKRINGDFN